MLQELRRSNLILCDEWAAVPLPTQQELGECPDSSILLGRLVELRLLTQYQVGRIRGGSIQDLILGNYRIIDFLGAGGMGTVFKAEHKRLRRPVAIKVVTLGPGENAVGLERFFNEMRAVAQLNHPNIAVALDAGEKAGEDLHAGDLHYFVMEFVPGQDLEEYVKVKGPLDPSLACDFVFQIAGALEEAHEHGLVHRDIKPSNIRVTPEGKAKLLDFGIARNATNRLTAHGAVLGSVAYLAPEQAEDASAVDIRADLYGLGGTLYWCLTGQHPFPHQGNLIVEIARRLKQPAPSIRTIRPQISEGLDAILACLMACKPDDRYASPREVMNALFPFLKPGSHSLDNQILPLGIAARLPENEMPTAGHVHRILIVDDEKSNRMVFSMMLASPGLQCEAAADGVLALEALHAQPFDLVVLDIDMPRMQGTDVLRRLRESPPCPHLKIIMASGRATPDEMAQMMLAGADDYLAKPFSSIQFQARVKAALRLKDAQDRSDGMHRHMLAVNQELEQNVHARDSDLVHARNAMVLALAELVSYRDNETGAHLQRLQDYSRVLVETASKATSFAGQIDASFVRMVECCAPLHDIGKAGLPDHILLKPGKLTTEEFAVMRTHTTIGADLLQKVAKKHGFAKTFLQMAVDITRHHHERFDGKGYPDCLAGDDIPLSARIVAIADVYDALRSRRVYKPALPHVDVVRIMREESEGHFDPALMLVFRECAERFDKLFVESSD
jgi:response regulator RpfG family c-di-GMP phosphodiesterase/serine/threonine protein kinase